MKNLILILGICCFTAVAATAEEEYYTWVDENGITNYAERNPEGINATFVSQSQSFGRRPGGRSAAESPAASADPSASQSAATGNGNLGPDPDALVNEQAAILAAERADIMRKNCEIGKNNLAQIKAFSRLRVTDENGQNRILTEAEKEARAEVARQTIRDNCSA